MFAYVSYLHIVGRLQRTPGYNERFDRSLEVRCNEVSLHVKKLVENIMLTILRRITPGYTVDNLALGLQSTVDCSPSVAQWYVSC